MRSHSCARTSSSITWRPGASRRLRLQGLRRHEAEQGLRAQGLGLGDQRKHMDAQVRKKLIDEYKDGYRQVAEALAGATEQELDTHPAPGKWSAREIVHHLADSEMTSAI